MELYKDEKHDITIQYEEELQGIIMGSRGKYGVQEEPDEEICTYTVIYVDRGGDDIELELKQEYRYFEDMIEDVIEKALKHEEPE